MVIQRTLDMDRARACLGFGSIPRSTLTFFDSLGANLSSIHFYIITVCSCIYHVLARIAKRCITTTTAQLVIKPAQSRCRRAPGTGLVAPHAFACGFSGMAETVFINRVAAQLPGAPELEKLKRGNHADQTYAVPLHKALVR